MKLCESMELESADGDLNANMGKKNPKYKIFLPRQRMVL